MLRTHISLTTEDRRTLDLVAARTGQSISALIRAAVETVYVAPLSTDEELASMRRAFGCWKDRDLDGAALVARLRSSQRLH